MISDDLWVTLGKLAAGLATILPFFCQQTSATLLSGTSVTINDTAPARDPYNFAICEILSIQSLGRVMKRPGPYSQPRARNGELRVLELCSVRDCRMCAKHLTSMVLVRP